MTNQWRAKPQICNSKTLTSQNLNQVFFPINSMFNQVNWWILFNYLLFQQNGKNYIETQLNEKNLSWADGIMLVYDVGDIATFEYAKNVIESMTEKVKSRSQEDGSRKKFFLNFKPLLLVGNKTDLVVSWSWDFLKILLNCLFYIFFGQLTLHRS